MFLVKDVVIQVVTIMPCSQLCQFVPDDMFGWHVSVASELSTIVHECDIFPDLVEDVLNECSMKVGRENDNISIGLTELSPNNVDVCVESNVCQVTVIHDYDIEFLDLNENLQDGRKEIVQMILMGVREYLFRIWTRWKFLLTMNVNHGRDGVRGA